VKLADGRLVIAVPTVPRERDYVEETVEALLGGVPPAARARTELVLFNATVPPARHAAAARLARRHAGRITVLDNPDGYPSLEDGAARAADPRRHAWRKKVALDLARLTRFCATRGDLCLYVEDDVLPERGYLTALTRWFDERFAERDDWSLLSLWSADGFRDGDVFPLDRFYSTCALLFRARDLPGLADFVEARADEDAADFLVRDWARTTGRPIRVRHPPLFQHVGLFSSEGALRPESARAYPEHRAVTLLRRARELVEVAVRHPSWLPALVLSRTRGPLPWLTQPLARFLVKRARAKRR
jgi:hypothetical protein